MTKPTQKLVRFDWAMKHILRDKANFDVLEGFLTCLLKEKITIEDLLESESNQDAKDEKFNRVDLKCKDTKGQQIIIEVQSQRQVDYFERMAWGASKALVESVKLGEKYASISKIISVSIIYYDLPFPDRNDDYFYYGKTNIIGRHNKKPLLLQHGITEKSVTSGDIFPEYYVICVGNFDDTIREQVDEWVYMFKNEETQEDFHSPGIAAAVEKLSYLGMSVAERTKYEADIYNASNAASILATAVLDGERKGEKRGLKKGEKIGLKKGKAEAHQEIARKMLAMKLPLEVIEQATGFSVAELKKLSKEI